MSMNIKCNKRIVIHFNNIIDVLDRYVLQLKLNNILLY